MKLKGKAYFRMIGRAHARLGFRDLSMLIRLPDWAQKAYYEEWMLNCEGGFIYTKR